MSLHDDSHINTHPCEGCTVPRCKGEFALGPLYFRPVTLAEGEDLPYHRHPKDHISIVIRGRVRVSLRDGDGPPDVKEYEAGNLATCLILVPAGVEHEFVAVGGPAVTACTFAHYDADDRPSQTYSLRGEAAYR